MTTIGHNKLPSGAVGRGENSERIAGSKGNLSEILPYVGAGALAAALSDVLLSSPPLTVAAALAGMVAYGIYKSTRKRPI